MLLDNTKVLSLLDTGSIVNLLSESVIKSNKYLSSLPTMNCPEHRIRNTGGEMKANKFIELCFKVKDDYKLKATALVVQDYGSVQFLLCISSISQLNSVIDVNSRQISIRKKSFVFKTCFHNRIKAHDALTIGVKCMLPKALRNGDFISKPFCPFYNIFTFEFCSTIPKRENLFENFKPHCQKSNYKSRHSYGKRCF